ncbi:hypothetical protein TSAR_002057, partial [Trichomalopsis sarcophagae]
MASLGSAGATAGNINNERVACTAQTAFSLRRSYIYICIGHYV